MKYNYSKLSGKINEKFTTRNNFANALGISENSLSLKLNNKRLFKQSEISKSISLLGISTDEVHSYFFDSNVK